MLIYGSGTMGLMMLELAKRTGAASVDVLDVNAQRLATATTLGCTGAAARADELDRPGGWDVVIDATGNAAAIQDGLGRVAKGGTFLQFGVSDYATTAVIEPYRIYNQEITITGSMAVLHSYERAAALFASGVLDASVFISDRLPLEQYPQAVDVSGGHRPQDRGGAVTDVPADSPGRERTVLVAGEALVDLVPAGDDAGVRVAQPGGARQRRGGPGPAARAAVVPGRARGRRVGDRVQAWLSGAGIDLSLSAARRCPRHSRWPTRGPGTRTASTSGTRRPSRCPTGRRTWGAWASTRAARRGRGAGGRRGGGPRAGGRPYGRYAVDPNVREDRTLDPAKSLERLREVRAGGGGEGKRRGPGAAVAGRRPGGELPGAGGRGRLVVMTGVGQGRHGLCPRRRRGLRYRRGRCG
ncbi:L-threonine 3-dehydrogenase [Streptomyces californicus]